MKTALEEELSDALVRRAASMPQGATDRLLAVDYHPRRHRQVLGVPVAVGAGAGAAAASAATVGTVLAVALGGAAPAYAGWSATPTLSSAPISTAPDCVSTLTSASAGASGTGAGTGTGTGTWQTLLSDVRGPFTVTLLQNGTSYATCFTGPSFTEVNQITSPSGTGGAQSGELSVSSQTANTGGSGGSKASSVSPGGVGSLVSLEGTSSGDLNQVLQNHLTTSADGPYTFIDGRVANGVTGVTLALKDGQNIVATVADGWFVAWWPGSSDATSAQVTKASGTTSEPFVPVSQMGTKFPLGQAGSSSGVPVPPSPANGTCTATPPSSTPTTSSASATSGGPSVDCKASTSTGSGGPSSGKSGNTGTTGNTGTGSSGAGPTTKSNP